MERPSAAPTSASAQGSRCRHDGTDAARLPGQGAGPARAQEQRHAALGEEPAPQDVARVSRPDPRLSGAAQHRHVSHVVGSGALRDASGYAAVPRHGRGKRRRAARDRRQSKAPRHPLVVPSLAVRAPEQPRSGTDAQEHLGSVVPGRDARSHGARPGGGAGDACRRHLRRCRCKPGALGRDLADLAGARAPPPRPRARRHQVQRRRRPLDRGADRCAAGVRLSALLVPEPRSASTWWRRCAPS